MYDDRYGYPGIFDLRRCTGCGHAHIRTEFSAADLSQLYTQYYPRASFVIENYRVPSASRGIAAWFSGVRSAAFRWVPKNVRVLDIGCGLCETLGYHRSRGCEVYGVEADENVRRVAEHFGFNVHVGLFDADMYEREFFDYVTLDQVIEHVTDPLKVMSGIARILRPGGTLVLSTPNLRGWGARVFGRRWINWHVPYHVHQFTRKSLSSLAAKTGMRVTGWRTLTHSDWMFFQAIHLLAKPMVGEKHPFWNGERWPTPSQERRHQVLGQLRRIGLFKLGSRLFDTLGLGDNSLFFLCKPAEPSSPAQVASR